MIVGTNCTPDAPGLLAVDVPLLVPSAHESSYFPRMVDICHKYQIEMLLSLHDLEVMVLSKHLGELSGNQTHLVVPSAISCEICLDKYAGFRFLSERGVHVPKTCLGSREATRMIASGELAAPVVVKPRWGTGSHSQFMTSNAADLPVLCRYAERSVKESAFAAFFSFGVGEGAIVQERVCGTEYGLNVVNDLNGNYVASLVLRKLGMRSGETDSAETVVEPSLVALGTLLGNLLRHRGVLDVDVMVRNGELYVLDLNPRFGGQYPFWHEAGADVPSALLAWRKGETPRPEWFTPTSGIRHFKEIVLNRSPSTQENGPAVDPLPIRRGNN